ncbi:hypothetical protein [Rhizobium sp. ICMP 5592]|uniref:hypothetical protein n=1 Tax=Rhizobium sp. ICMP 5592 TaxID=2292445 RepID=UPI0012979840|nr:hypothetical protein [Rhizobium sp. ICMP 5592]MQB46054.1 hypothetical protein [Rhizobium sp. ICMP 5592]
MTEAVSVQLQLTQIPDRILGLAIAALHQANTHAVFMDPGNEHWSLMSVLNTAHAGELFIKSIIANVHPLLVFKKVDPSAIPTDETEIATLLSTGMTHNFEKLPSVLLATTGISVPDLALFERLRKARNSIQHFCPPDGEEDPSALSLEFIYSIIDPLIHAQFGLFAIEYHEDHNVSYDYVVGTLLRRQIRFSVPEDFAVTEVELEEEIDGASESYKAWFRLELQRIGKADLITF